MILHYYNVEWFENYFMKLNQDKCHLLVSWHKNENVWAKIRETKIWGSNKQKLVGAVIDRNLNFDEYVFDLCKKASRKLCFNKIVELYEF